MPTDGTLIFDTNIDAAQFHNALQEMKKYADGVTSEISGGFTVLKGTLANLLSGAIAGVTGQLSGLASSVMSTGMSFESSMSEVQALSGATAEEMQKLTDAAKEYGASTQYTASESAQALKYMALAGWDAEQSTAALPSVLNLAASAGMDLAQASDIVTDYVSAFGLEAADAAKLADELSYAQANSNTSVEQLSEAYKNCAANLHANGQSMETTTALLSMMANQGFKGAESGTALTAAMRDISNAMELVDGTTRQYAVSIGDTAIAVTDAEGNFRQLTDIYADVEKATDGMSEAERNAALSSVFTADSIKAANYVLAAGSDAAKDFAADLEGAAGTSADAAATMQDNFKGAVTRLSSAFDGLKVSVFEELKEPLRQIIDTLTDTLSSPKVQSAVSGIAKTLGQAFQKLADKLPDIIAFVDKNLPKAIKTIEKIAGFLWNNKGLVAGIGAAFAVTKVSSFASSLSPVVSSLKNIPSLISGIATPWGAVTAAIGLAAAGVAAYKIKVAEAKKAIADNVSEAAKLSDNMETVKDSIDGVKDNYENFRDSLGETKISIDLDYQNAEELKEKLLSYLNPDGSIKAGYEKEVNDVIAKLNEITGTSYSVSEGVIVDNDGVQKSYREISDEIENVIQKQRAMAEYDAVNAERASRQSDYNTAQQAIVATTAELEKLQDEQDNAAEKMKSLFGSNQLAGNAISIGDAVGFYNFSDFADEFETQIDKIIESAGDLSDSQNLENANQKIAELIYNTRGFQFENPDDLKTWNQHLEEYAGNLLEIGQNQDVLKDANETAAENEEYLQKMERLDKAILDSDWNKVNDIFATLATNVRTTATAGTDELKEQYELYKRNAAAAKELFDQGTVSAETYQSNIQALADATVEYAKSGGAISGEELWNAIANSSMGKEEKLASFKDVLINGFTPDESQIKAATAAIGDEFTSELAAAIESSGKPQQAIDNTAANIDTGSFADSGAAAGNTFLNSFQAVLNGITGFTSSILANATAQIRIGHNASGTNSWRGGLTWINEQGGELVNLPNGTQIIPHDISMRYADRMAASVMDAAGSLASAMPAQAGASGSGASLSATIPVIVNIGEEKIEETVMHVVSRANANTGGWSI